MRVRKTDLIYIQQELEEVRAMQFDFLGLRVAHSGDINMALIEKFYHNAPYYMDILFKHIQELNDRYAHEGGRPQVLNVDILKTWLRSIDIPIVTDIYQTAVPNVFYASFGLRLEPEHEAQIQALGVKVEYPNSSLRNRYMLIWKPPQNDETP